MFDKTKEQVQEFKKDVSLTAALAPKTLWIAVAALVVSIIALVVCAAPRIVMTHG
jgi:hypothetical protein